MKDIEEIRADFPILEERVHGKPLIYLDNGATTQVPRCVEEAVSRHYRHRHSNVHRAMHALASASTRELEEARGHVARFVNAPSSENVVFTRGTTEAISTVALGLRNHIGPDDHILTTVLEHHSNFVPWQQLAKERGAAFDVCQMTKAGDLDVRDFKRLLQEHPKIVALTCCSNVLGTRTPIDELVALAHEAGSLVLLDGAQIMRHRAIDVQEIGCDYFAFSGHKIMAGTGIGALCGTTSALELLTPSEYGGEMVDVVTAERTTYADLPLRLEAGTPNSAGAVALDAALGYLEKLGREDIALREDRLVAYADEALSAIPGVEVEGCPERRSGCVSFVVDGAHPFDVSVLVDTMGLALRSGHMCAQPLLAALGQKSVLRLSPAFYNTFDEIDAAVACIERAIRVLGGE